MAQELSQRQENDIIEVFRLFDVDGSGTISTHELDAAIRCLGKSPTEDDKRLGESDNGNITQSKFLSLMKKKLSEELREEEYQEAFQAFDKDGNGFLSADELQRIITGPGGGLTEDEAKHILKDADINMQDTHVNYKELVELKTS